MESWSLKVKFGTYAAALAIVALCGAAGTMLPFIYFTQRAQLDNRLLNEAKELVRDLENFKGAPINVRQPLSAKFIPVSLQNRLLIVKGPEGQILYSSPGLKAARLSELESGYETTRINGEKQRVASFQEGFFFLQIGASMEPLHALQKTLLKSLAVATPIAALCVFGGGFLLGRVAVRPIAKLSDAAERINVNRLDERLPLPPSRDEIASMTIVLNSAFDRLQKAYEAATRFSADASHQLKTPIAVLRAGLEELRFEDSDKARIQELLKQTRRLTALINDLLLLAQADAGRLQLESVKTDIAPLINAACDDLEAIIQSKAIRIQKTVPEMLEAMADSRRISLVLQTLIENAAKYTTDPGEIRIEALNNGKTIEIHISNTAKPIPTKEQEGIFERFRRGSLIGETIAGQGLGLNIAKTLMRAHDGDLVLARSDEVWTEFVVTLPSVREIK